jgi:hypothetical protein
MKGERDGAQSEAGALESERDELKTEVKLLGLELRQVTGSQ